MKNLVRVLVGVSFLSISFQTFAQSSVEMADTMRADGKIYVVVGIILIVLVGLVAYLFLLDRKIGKLERQLGEQNGKTK